ncbi:hypothetical protein [Shewanella decolorationis]|uniref:hypothetical protein n=1 Tax=Shewanella decolorationis TaxID=256839 RepID=UPI0010573C8C|nr:hypothetical protein [Shewanella decolorationis]
MCKTAKFTEFGRKQRSDIYVVISEISHFYSHNNRFNAGTVISLKNGYQIVVDENIETVLDAIEQAAGDNRNE